MMQLTWQNAVLAALNLPLFNHELLLCQMFLLSCHEILLFLFSSLKGILLLGSQSRAKTGKATSKWWLLSAGRTCYWRLKSPCCVGRRLVSDAYLWH